MITDTSKKESFASCLIEDWLELFNQTDNPIYAWRTYDTARKLKKPIPNEILQYLDAVAQKIVKIANNPPLAKVRPIEISRALGLGKKGGGAASVFKEYNARLTAKRMAAATFYELKECEKDYIVYQEIADRYKTSESTVRRNYLEHLEKWQTEINILIEKGYIAFDPEKNGVELKMRFYGDSDDMREMAIILELIKEKSALEKTKK